MRSIQPILFNCQPTDQFPNSLLPVILYQDALPSYVFFRRTQVRRILGRNGWSNVAVGGINTTMHYHSNNHVVIVMLRGSSDLVVGGYRGHRFRVAKGDILIIPAGVAYKNLGRQYDVTVITAWPGGIKGDVNVGLPGERPAADLRIAAVVTPHLDPILGASGPLLQTWDPDLDGHPESLMANRHITGSRRN